MRDELAEMFDRVERSDGWALKVPRCPTVKSLGPSPWEMRVPDLPSLVPDECTDMVEALVWRGRRYVLEEA